MMKLVQNQQDDITCTVIQTTISVVVKETGRPLFVSDAKKTDQAAFLPLSHASEDGDLSNGPGLYWPVRDYNHYRPASLEGLCLHWRQSYCHGGTLGGLMDELLQTC